MMTSYLLIEPYGLIIYAIICFFIMDWDWFHGGEAKVVYLGKIDDVRIPVAYKPQNISVLKDK